MKKRHVILSALLALVLASTTSITAKAGVYRSELTNEPIDLSLQTQRPIAVMVDNEKTALAHYGVNRSDIVYEMMNSTANGRITRLMCVVKDWKNLTQFGSIRSARPTNFMVAAEYNAILVHDGGPFYINPYVAAPYTNNLSGGFARFSNGKRTEFTEYVTSGTYKNPTTGKTYGGLNARVARAGYSSTYNAFYQGPHFTFAEAEYSLDGLGGTVANQVILPFPHNGSQLHFNQATGTYDYYEYGSAHIDALDGKVTTFKNVILQNVSYGVYDANGYMVYNVVGAGNGLYLTNGKAIPINWSKATDSAITYFTYADGTPLKLNTGKTYIGLVPSDVWPAMLVK